MKQEKTSPLAASAPGARFRPQIESAIAAGAAPEAMTLRLTLRDVAQMLRDPAIALHDIRFDAGTMYFLSVRVEKGGVPVSLLDIGEAAPDVA